LGQAPNGRLAPQPKPEELGQDQWVVAKVVAPEVRLFEQAYEPILIRKREPADVECKRHLDDSEILQQGVYAVASFYIGARMVHEKVARQQVLKLLGSIAEGC
jgi:hypothetical protein